MAGKHPLSEYRRKRKFGATPEPAGGAGDGTGNRRGRRTSPIFVVHEHRARAHHYDLRLEDGGVLKCWAVPKGPSPDPSVKRLAVRTEDHPLEYRNFEGVIPGGQYGAGVSILWDAGHYRNLTERDGSAVPVEEAIEAGHLTVSLDGQKLHGAYALTRLPRQGREQWLLVKVRDEFAADGARDAGDDRSVKSGKTIEELAEPVLPGDRRR